MKFHGFRLYIKKNLRKSICIYRRAAFEPALICEKMNVFNIILVFLSSFSFSSQQGMLKGKFKNLKTFDKLLPEHIGAYLVPIFKSTLFGCTSKCLIHALCDGFLFNSISNDCGLLRCSLLGLQTTASESTWRYFSGINSK